MIRPCKATCTHVIFAGIALSFAINLSVTAQDVRSGGADIRSVTVSGKGRLYVVPDLATVRFGIVTVDENAEVARTLNAEAASESMNVLRAMGIDERKIRLEALTLEPNRVMDEAVRRFVEKGFRAVREVSVILEDLDRLPELIAGVVQGGANRIQGISYGLKNRRDIELQALKLAMKDAQKRADVMVTTLGVHLGDVLRISEQGVVVPRPVLRMEKSAGMNELSAAAMPDAFASGEMEIIANVTVVFAIKGGQ